MEQVVETRRKVSNQLAFNLMVKMVQLIIKSYQKSYLQM